MTTSEASENLVDVSKWQCILTPTEARRVIREVGKNALDQLADVPCTLSIVTAVRSMAEDIPRWGEGRDYQKIRAKEAARPFIENLGHFMNEAEATLSVEHPDLMAHFQALKKSLDSIMRQPPQENPLEKPKSHALEIIARQASCIDPSQWSSWLTKSEAHKVTKIVTATCGPGVLETLEKHPVTKTIMSIIGTIRGQYYKDSPPFDEQGVFRPQLLTKSWIQRNPRGFIPKTPQNQLVDLDEKYATHCLINHPYEDDLSRQNTFKELATETYKAIQEVDDEHLRLAMNMVMIELDQCLNPSHAKKQGNGRMS